MNSRLIQTMVAFKEHKIDCLLVTNDPDATYLTHHPSSESWLLVGRGKAVYITDARYANEVKKHLKGIEVYCYTKNLYEAVLELAQAMVWRRIGFDPAHVTLAQYQIFKKKCPQSIELVQTNGIVANLREVKDKSEVALIRKALHIHKEAYFLLKKWVKPGVSERDILHKLQDFIREHKVDFSFDPIIASGLNSCYPHARVTDRKLHLNEPVLVDMGIDVKGYKSDLTRMFFLGRIPRLISQVNEHVRLAQRKAIEKIKPGVTVKEVDEEARNYLAKYDLAKYFGHSLGHGVGLEIHEDPRVSQKSSAILKEGMIITVEPAVYIPNKFGIRIEDMVLLTRKSCEVLSDDIY